MKITGYNQVVGTGGAVNATVKAVSDLNAYGGKGNGARAVSNALGKVQAAYEHVAEEEDKRALMSAMDIYNKGRYDILYNDENGVLNTKLEGAAGSVGSYIEREKKLRNDIMGNIKFKTQKYQLVFQDMVGKSAEQGYQLVDRHEYKEMEAQKDLTLNNNLENMLQFAQKNYGDDGIVADAMEQGRLYIAERFGDRGEEFLNKINSQFEGKAGEMLINQAVMAGEFDRADELKAVFDEAFTADQRAKVERLLFTKKQDQYEMSLAQELAARYGNDIGGVVNELKGTNAFGTDRLMDLREQQTVLNMVQNINNTNKAIERANFDKLFDSSLDAISKMVENKTLYTDLMKWASEQAGGNPDNLKALQSAVNICSSRGSGAGFKPIPEGEMLAIDELLRNGEFETEAKYMAYLEKLGADKKQIVKARQNYKDFRNGTGKYAYDFDNLKLLVMGKSTLKDSEKAKWNGAVKATGDDIANFIIEKKRQPTDGEVRDMLTDNMTKGVRLEYQKNAVWWSTIRATNAELALLGIETINKIDDDNFIITYMDGRKESRSAQATSDLVEGVR